MRKKLTNQLSLREVLKVFTNASKALNNKRALAVTYLLW